jgi:DNA modification methylase
MVFSKDRFRLDDGGKTGITGGQFVDWTRSIWRPEEAQGGQSSITLAELERKLKDKLKDARQRDKDDAWIAESMARVAWQYINRSGDTIWSMTTESGVDHPAPFPVELPRRLILLYTRPGDLVLDPFMGAGATAVAAVQTGRHYVGYDVSEEYCALARKRVAESSQVDK